MTVKLLVVGLVPYDAGKTTIAESITLAIRDIGIKPLVYKPFSAHNWYLQYGTTIENLKSGMLFCEDILKLRKIADIKEPYEILNPVDTLMAPLDPEYYIKNRMLRYYFIQLNDNRSHIVASRITIYVKQVNKHYNLILINKRAIKGKTLITKDIEKLVYNADRILEEDRLDEYIAKLEQLRIPAITSTLSYLEEKYTHIIIESYNDAAYPLPLNIKVDYVIAVSPGKAMIYDAKDYLKAIHLKAMISKTYQIKTSDILDLLKPRQIIKIPPITNPIQKLAVGTKILEKTIEEIIS